MSMYSFRVIPSSQADSAVLHRCMDDLISWLVFAYFREVSKTSIKADLNISSDAEHFDAVSLLSIASDLVEYASIRSHCLGVSLYTDPISSE